MTATAILSSRFRLPIAAREQQQWQVGQEFAFIPRGKGLLVIPVLELKQLAGLAKGASARAWRDRKDRF